MTHKSICPLSCVCTNIQCQPEVRVQKPFTADMTEAWFVQLTTQHLVTILAAKTVTMVAATRQNPLWHDASMFVLPSKPISSNQYPPIISSGDMMISPPAKADSTLVYANASLRSVILQGEATNFKQIDKMPKNLRHAKIFTSHFTWKG